MSKLSDLWDAYAIELRKVMDLPEDSPQQKDALARCMRLADDIIEIKT